MGIPYYFRQIIRGNKDLLGSSSPVCNRLYLDFNSIIHVASQRVVNTKVWKNYAAMEQKIFEAVIHQTTQIVADCTPNQLLYIGIDGVAPLAKMAQQRKRRHMSALQNTMINDFKVKQRIPFNDWDSNCITPGTMFMAGLLKYIQNYYRHHPTDYEVIISGADEEGEGEHKIIKYIKSLGDDDPFTDIIYGLDADLIMLSLTCNKKKMFLMREENCPRQSHTSFKFLNIDKLRTAVSMYLYKDSNILYMYDYVCICFFLGNDFLPHHMSFDIKHNGLETICDLYRDIHRETKEYMVKLEGSKYVINKQFLERFLHALAQIEEGRFKHVVSKHYNTHTPVINTGKTPLERFTFDMMNTPTTRKQKIIDPETDPFWKSTYYNTFFSIVPKNLRGIDEICSAYILGMYWNIDYYLNGCFSHDWFYKYNAAPFIADIGNYLKKNQDIKRLTPTEMTITPLEQLVTVLPCQSHHILDSVISAKLMSLDKGIPHLYPSNFQVITFLKSQLWECTPILPTLDIMTIKNHLST